MPRISVEYLAGKRRFKPEVLARIRRLNPIGVPQGRRIRGYHPKRRAPAANLAFSVMSPRDFVARFGRKEYEAVPRGFLLREGHRKGIAREYIEDHF